MRRKFKSKDEARRAVWRELQAQRVARFPFPVEGRIPNFAGAREAADRLCSLPAFQRIRRIKVNPDSPQRPVRAALLRRGVVVFMPTPRLKAGFYKLDPRQIPPEKYSEAAGLKGSKSWSEEVPLSALPEMDLIVTGSVAVTRTGHRCGKGHGYSDLEYGILRELGHPPLPVATTVHSIQLVDEFPTDEHDLPVTYIATPDEVIEVDDPPAPPEGIDWSRVDETMLQDMPVLRELTS